METYVRTKIETPLVGRPLVGPAIIGMQSFLWGILEPQQYVHIIAYQLDGNSALHKQWEYLLYLPVHPQFGRNMVQYLPIRQKEHTFIFSMKLKTV